MLTILILLAIGVGISICLWAFELQPESQFDCHIEYKPKMTCSEAVLLDFPEHEHNYILCTEKNNKCWDDCKIWKPQYHFDSTEWDRNYCLCEIYENAPYKELINERVEGEYCYIPEKYENHKESELIDKIEFYTKESFYNEIEVCE